MRCFSSLQQRLAADLFPLLVEHDALQLPRARHTSPSRNPADEHAAAASCEDGRP